MSNLIENLKKEQNLSFAESKMLFSDLPEDFYWVAVYEFEFVRDCLEGSCRAQVELRYTLFGWT